MKYLMHQAKATRCRQITALSISAHSSYFQRIITKRALAMLSSFTLIAAAFLGIVVRNSESSSYTDCGYGNNKYGTKTGHFWMFPAKTPVENHIMIATLDGRTCSAVHVNIVSRHGARYTSVKDMRAFTVLQKKLQGAVGNQEYAFIDSWVNPYPEDKDSLLTALGEKEMYYLGSKYGVELHDLLNGSIDGNGNITSLKFGATKDTRTQESANWFFRGLYGENFGQNFTTLQPEIRNKILRFFDNCKRQEQETADLSEQTQFQNGPEFQQMIRQIENRLMTNLTLTVGDVKMIYRLCATELAIMNNSDWCTILTDDHREILEYENDIEDYIARLYGHPVTGEMSCPLGRDIFTAMDNVINDLKMGISPSYTRGVFQFGHSDTVVDFAAGLGLFRDNDSIRADNFQDMRTRQFQSSKVDPFSTHLAFILYNCGGTETQNYALRLLFNGNPLAIPKCNNDICWYHDVRHGYRHFVDDCDWDKICAINSQIVG